MSKLLPALIAASALWAASPASAGELDPALLSAPELPVTKPVQAGGWYLRGSLGYSVDTASRDFSSDWSGSAGFGHRFSDFLRADVTLEYGEGSYAGPGTESFRSYGGMVNGYFDLGTFAGFTPYVGAGAGYLNVDWGDYTDAASAVHPGRSDWRFAYQLSAGLAYALTTNLKLDFGYRYLDVGGGDRYVDAAGTRVRDGGFAKSEIRAGLRYAMW